MWIMTKQTQANSREVLLLKRLWKSFSAHRDLMMALFTSSLQIHVNARIHTPKWTHIQTQVLWKAQNKGVFTLEQKKKNPKTAISIWSCWHIKRNRNCSCHTLNLYTWKNTRKSTKIKHGKRLVKLRAVKEKSGFGKENCPCSEITSPPMGVSLFAGGSRRKIKNKRMN